MPFCQGRSLGKQVNLDPLAQEARFFGLVEGTKQRIGRCESLIGPNGPECLSGFFVGTLYRAGGLKQVGARSLEFQNSGSSVTSRRLYPGDAHHLGPHSTRACSAAHARAKFMAHRKVEMRAVRFNALPFAVVSRVPPESGLDHQRRSHGPHPRLPRTLHRRLLRPFPFAAVIALTQTTQSRAWGS
jgi:hypothetical protein